jgi:hypothetical protein
MTPEELREFEVRHSPASDILRDIYGRADLTEDEFRTMYDLRREFESRHPEPSGEDWKTLEAAYAENLGPERYQDLQRQNDSMWRAMQDLAGENGLAPDALARAFELKEAYTEHMARAVGEMFADPQQDLAPCAKSRRKWTVAWQKSSDWRPFNNSTGWACCPGSWSRMTASVNPTA